ncbi:hypothetical protein JCM24511_04259 [Saitozyma sp. JCM 24511]|nr:hypothetical protein JCM24511_04259 [Saitozyma sp. JCM 24511]
MSDYHNIVIIGGRTQPCQRPCPNLATTHRILLLDALDFGFWPIDGLRVTVVPRWEERVTAPLNTSTVFPSGTAHGVIPPTKVFELRELDRPREDFRSSLFSATEESYLAELDRMPGEIAKVTKVVVIGSGAAGVEMAGVMC